jgi:RimJ/RimL family protein N-acetyltransferase
MNTEFSIYTQRLSLRLLKVEHAQEFCHAVRQSHTLHQWIDWCSDSFTLPAAQDFINATRLNWIRADAFGFAIFDRKSESFVGMIAINEFYQTFNMASLGYWVIDKYQGKGFALEALEAIIEFCFATLKLTRLEIVCDVENLPSQKLALRCGAARECVAQNRFIFNGKPKQGVVFAITPT